MLVLSRKVGERLVIGQNIELTINRISGNRVAIGIVAPNDIEILRGELVAEGVALDAAPATISMHDSAPLHPTEAVPNNRGPLRKDYSFSSGRKLG